MNMGKLSGIILAVLYKTPLLAQLGRLIWAFADSKGPDQLAQLCKQRPRSACSAVQSDKGLHYPQTESLDTTEYFNGE